MSDCKYGDPTCPCQDGDMCHYEGENPSSVPSEYVLARITGLESYIITIEGLLAASGKANITLLECCERQKADLKRIQTVWQSECNNPTGRLEDRRVFYDVFSESPSQAAPSENSGEA